MVQAIRYGQSFQLLELQKALLHANFRIEKEGEVLIVTRETTDETLFVFPFGTAVLWEYSEIEKQTLEEILIANVHSPFDHPYGYEDEFETEENDFFKVSNDILFLPKEFSLSDKLAISYAISQSTALLYLEKRISSAEILLEKIPKELAEKGRSYLSDKNLRKLIGQVLQKKHEVNLGMGFSETPDYFWEYPDCQPIYKKVHRYLEIQSRITTLNNKIGILHETLEVLRDESNARHSAILEWIIIWLIVFEVVMTIWEQFIHPMIQS